MATSFLVAKNNATGTLKTTIDDSVTSLTLDTAQGTAFPSTYPFDISMDDEILRCTNRSSDVFTVTREVQSTTATSHEDGTDVNLYVTAQEFTDLNTAVNDLETAIDGIPIGGVTPAAGAFTTLDASGALVVVGTITAGTNPHVLTTAAGLLAGAKIDPGTIPAGSFVSEAVDISADTNLTAGSGIVLTLDALTHDTAAGYVHVPTAGASANLLQYTSAGTAKWITMSGQATIADAGAVTLDLSSPGAIGDTTSAAGYFTTLTSSESSGIGSGVASGDAGSSVAAGMGHSHDTGGAGGAGGTLFFGGGGGGAGAGGNGGGANISFGGGSGGNGGNGANIGLANGGAGSAGNGGDAGDVNACQAGTGGTTDGADGTFTIGNAAIANAELVVNGNATVTGDLDVGGDGDFTGDLNAVGEISIGTDQTDRGALIVWGDNAANGGYVSIVNGSTGDTNTKTWTWIAADDLQLKAGGGAQGTESILSIDATSRAVSVLTDLNAAGTVTIDSAAGTVLRFTGVTVGANDSPGNALLSTGLVLRSKLIKGWFGPSPADTTIQIRNYNDSYVCGIDMDGDLDVGGAADIAGNATVSGDLDVVGSITAGVDKTTQGVIIAYGDSSANGGGVSMVNGDTGDTNTATWSWLAAGNLQLNAYGGAQGTESILSIDATSRAVSVLTDLVGGANVDFDALPTSDPVHAGRLWNDSGTAKISAGA